MINLLKASSLVSVIAGGDLLTQAQLWYLVIISMASAAQYLVERRLGRGR